MNTSNVTDQRAFKHYFDGAAATALAEQVSAADARFDRRRFLRMAKRSLDTLEFNARVRQFSDALRAALPDDVPDALAILTQSLPPPLPDCEAVTDGWLQWPVGQFIADHGLAHFDASMTAMTALTMRFSAEYAVRPFVEQYPEDTFQRLYALVDHDSAHVRRWCSEGTRPRLPWARHIDALIRDPSPIWPILDALRDDPERYVQRSVANNLNDIAKDHPGQVIAACRRWQSTAEATARDWIVRHGLRSLVKQGNTDALAVLGYAQPRRLSAALDISPKRISVGESVTLSALLSSTSRAAQPLLIDYIVHYVRKRGAAGAKVFKWGSIDLPARGNRSLTRSHPMRTTTVRALYPGRHRVQLQINGVVAAEAAFVLV